jgi:hypothetical protein
MTVGIAASTFADLILAALDTGTANVISSHAQPHTADPGAAGTTSVFTSVGTQRTALTWAAASGTTTRSRASTNGTWSITGSGTVSHVSVWSASTAGSFRFSVALDTAKTVGSGDTLNLTSLSFGLTPIAA